MSKRDALAGAVVSFVGLMVFLLTRSGDLPALAATRAVGHPFVVAYPPPEVQYEVLPPPDTRRSHVVITGGAGFIGSQLGHWLHTKGHEVTLIDNMAFGYDDNLVVDGQRFGRFVLGDVMDPAIHRFLAGADVVFHFAALSALPVCQANPRDSMSVNVGGLANMLEGARLHGVRRFIFASTSAVYESNKEDVLTEDLPVNPHLLYSLSKYQGELLVRAYADMYDMDTVQLRFFNVYGPHQDFRRKSPPFTSYIVRELLNGRAPILHSTGEQKRDYVFVTDLIDLAHRVMTKDAARGEVFNVASGKSYSVNEMFSIVAKALNSKLVPMYRDARRFWDAYPELFQGKKPIKPEILVKEVNKRTTGSFAKAKRLLGWEPRVSMEEGLRMMLEYVRSHGAGRGSFDNAAWRNSSNSSGIV